MIRLYSAGNYSGADGVLDLYAGSPGIEYGGAGIVVNGNGNYSGGPLAATPHNSTQGAIALLFRENGTIQFANRPAGAGAPITRMQIDPAGHWFPGSDGVQDIGNAGLRMRTIYATTGSISTSDNRDKKNVGQVPEDWLEKSLRDGVIADTSMFSAVSPSDVVSPPSWT